MKCPHCNQKMRIVHYYSMSIDGLPKDKAEETGKYKAVFYSCPQSKAHFLKFKDDSIYLWDSRETDIKWRLFKGGIEKVIFT